MTKQRYKILTAPSTTELEILVNAQIGNGWRISGELIVAAASNGFGVFQVMLWV